MTLDNERWKWLLMFFIPLLLLVWYLAMLFYVAVGILPSVEELIGYGALKL